MPLRSILYIRLEQKEDIGERGSREFRTISLSTQVRTLDPVQHICPPHQTTRLMQSWVWLGSVSACCPCCPLAREDGPRIASAWWSGGVGGGAGLGPGFWPRWMGKWSWTLLYVTDSWVSMEFPSYAGSFFSMWEMSLSYLGSAVAPVIFICVYSYVCIYLFYHSLL